MSAIPYEIREAIIQCFGKIFWYKDKMEDFLIAAGVPRSLVSKYRDNHKFIWAKNILADLDIMQDGDIIQKKIITEICKLRNIPDNNVPDKNQALSTLRKFKELVKSYSPDHQDQSERKPKTINNESLLNSRHVKLRALYEIYTENVTTINRQQAGYSLEQLLYELFEINEIEYKKPYKAETQQIDGHFNFEGFDYLVEAKWRKDQPTDGEIGGFKRKVDSKLASTRGLFVSIQGFREEVIKAYSVPGNNIILLDGADLSLILEGYVDLKDALRFKIDRAVQYGEAFISLKSKFV